MQEPRSRAVGRTLKIWVIAAFAASTLFVAGAALLALVAPGSLHWPDGTPLGLASGYDAAADRRLLPSASPADLLEAARLSRAALDQAPYDTSASIRLAYVDVRRHGRLGPEGIAWLRHSYDQVAYDQYIAYWRIHFGLENWISLPPDLRQRVRNEAAAVAASGQHRLNLRRTLTAVRDPQGRLIASLWLARMNNGGLH